METQNSKSNTESASASASAAVALSVELQPGPAKNNQLQRDHPLASASSTAHTVDHDSWSQVGLMLVTSFNCGYILSFSNLMLVPLSWRWGITCLLLVGFFTAYANWLLAEFHFVSGQRFIRYRDLMGFFFGRKLFYLTWVFQFLTLLLGNMGFLLLGGRALKPNERWRMKKHQIGVFFSITLSLGGDSLKEINSEFSDSPLRLQYCIVMSGAAYFLFAFLVPTMSAMRRWLGASAVLTFTYILILLIVLVKDGKTNKNRDYEIKGSSVDKIFNGFGAISAIIVCNTSGLLPEIQSTLRKPAVANMKKALYMQYTVGLGLYYGVSIVGYWAYGSSVSEYLPKDLMMTGDHRLKWIKILINLASFVQSIISQHMFISPVHEALDTRFLDLEDSMNSRENIKRRFYLRALVFSGNTLVTAAFPFMGDFVNFLGSFALIPLTFVFPSMIFLKLKGKTARMEHNVWHWANILLFSLLSVATTISAVRLVVNNVRDYRLFADT